MSRLKTVSRRVSAIALALTFMGSGLLMTTNAGAATAISASPQVISECGVIEGNYLCGTPQWMQAALNAANNLNSTVSANAPAIKANLCKQIAAVTFVITTAVSFFPPTALITYLTGTGIGLTAGELTACNGW